MPTNTFEPTATATDVPTNTPEPAATVEPSVTPESTTMPTEDPVIRDALMPLVTNDGGEIPNGALVCVGGIRQHPDLCRSHAVDLPITNAYPYAAGHVTVIAGETATVALILVGYAEPGASTLIATTTVGTTVPSVPSGPCGGPVVTGLPSTGTGHGWSTAQLEILFGTSGVAGWRR